jgi:hypothetical protein
MATVGQSGLDQALIGTSALCPERRDAEGKAGPVLLLSGTAYASAYVVVGMTGLTAWSAVFAIAGTALVLLGLKLVAFRSS